MNEISTRDRLLGQLPESLIRWLNGREIEEIECLVSDLAGMARGKTMPAKKFFRGDRTYIPSSIFYQTITGDYAEVDVPNAWAEADLMLIPDLSTARAIPWSSDVSVQVFHDLQKVNGEPAGMAPRNVLKRVLALYAEEGLKPVVAPEMEFYITKPNIDPDYPISPPIGRTGREGVGRNSYSLIAVDEYGPVVDDIYDFAEAQGLEIDTMMQEGGAGQLEINLNHGDPVILADQVSLFKRTIREAALRHQCYATFMAKPMADEPGSAMHLHMSVSDARTGKNIFNSPDDTPSEAFQWFLGGQQTFVGAAMIMLAPYVNSYRRLVPDQSAPINLEWAADNRSVGLRIPVSDPNSRRIENRVIGMDCNPYLAIAACLACGYLGLKKKIQPREAFKGLPYEAPHALPRSVLDALERFEATPELQELLGVQFSSVYAAIKRHEYSDFLKVVSPWEREHLMLNV